MQIVIFSGGDDYTICSFRITFYIICLPHCFQIQGRTYKYTIPLRKLQTLLKKKMKQTI